MGATFQHTFSSSLCLYKRFVDDVLVVLSERVKTEQLLLALNTFCTDIICTNDGSESDTCVVFLDLDINIQGCSLVYSTHRKELATYNYTPYDSNHSVHTLLGIVATEAIRILRTNSHEDTFRFQRDIFVGKLKLRGFDLVQVRRIWRSTHGSQNTS